MKLIYTTTARIPTEKAHGLGTMKLCEALARLKLEVELICPWRFNKIKTDPFDYYNIERNFKIKKLPHLDTIPLGKFLGSIAARIASLEFSFINFCYVLIRGLFRSNIVFFSRNHFPLFFLSFLSGNVFYDVHDFPQSKSFLYKFYYQLLFKRLRGIIVTNSWKKQEFKKVFGIEDEKIFVFPNGVDIDKFNIKDSKKDCREKLGLPFDKKVVLYTGHLYKWKGVATLLEAAWKSEILNPKSETLFVFVGGTKKDIDSFKAQVLSFKLKNVLVVGHQLHSKIPFWLKAADVLVLPNTAKEDVSKYWTSPIKMFEYMASKRPIIASDLPSLREILNENNSVLVKPDNPEDLAQEIKKVLENSDLSDRISSQSFLDVQNYTWHKRAKNIIEVILKTKV